MSTTLSKEQSLACPYCQSTYVVKKGKRRNRLQTFQLYQCAECEYRFTAGPGRNRTYPLKVILDAVSTFNLGHSLADTQRILRRKAHVDIPEGTIRSWLAGYRPLVSYARIRTAAKKLFTPQNIIRTYELEHRQIYRFQLHRAKIELLLAAQRHRHLATINDYLGTVNAHFPHHLFQSDGHRSSKFQAQLAPPIARKENHATRTAALVLPTAPNNRKRHETLQRFMLINDSVTVAAEIPVYLTKEDIVYFRANGFALDFDSDIITGHIDFLQVRNGYLHVLDYKPEARKEKHAHVQLTIYALALSRRANLPLKNFKCAWFDDKDYFEFFPLQGVYWPKARSPNH